MKYTHLHYCLMAAAIGATGSAPALATNGYFTHGIGTHSKAMAGAGDAMPSMAIDSANNPASGVLVDEQLDLGLAIFSPRREYTVSPSQLNGAMGAFSLDAGKVESGSEYFPIPYVAKNWRLSDTSAFTLSFYGRGGMNTDYTAGSATFDPDGPGPAPVMSLPGTFGAGVTGVNLNQAFLELTYSFTLADSLALGFGPIIAYQLFEAEGLMTFAPYTKTFAASGGTAFPENLSNNGSDDSVGVGVKLGAIWNVSEAFALQTAYQSKISMSEFDDYSDLFAQAGGFDIPATARVGASIETMPGLKFHLDIEKTFYSSVDSIANALATVGMCPTAGLGGMDIESCAGGDRGFGFGWDDVTVYQMGAEWTPDSSRGITWRVGYSVSEQPISAADVLVNILAPATVEEHFTFGVSMNRDNGHQMSVALMYAPQKSVSGPNLFDPTQQIELAMDQFEIEFAYSF